MRVILSTSWSRGDVKPLVGLAVRWALGAVMRCVPRRTSQKRLADWY